MSKGCVRSIAKSTTTSKQADESGRQHRSRSPASLRRTSGKAGLLVGFIRSPGISDAANGPNEVWCVPPQSSGSLRPCWTTALIGLVVRARKDGQRRSRAPASLRRTSGKAGLLVGFIRSPGISDAANGPNEVWGVPPQSSGFLRLTAPGTFASSCAGRRTWGRYSE
jgi:hypothetical protein